MNTDICVFHLLHNAHQAAKRSFRCELEPTQYIVLKALRELGGELPPAEAGGF